MTTDTEPARRLAPGTRVVYVASGVLQGFTATVAEPDPSGPFLSDSAIAAGFVLIEYDGGGRSYVLPHEIMAEGAFDVISGPLNTAAHPDQWKTVLS